MTRLVPLLERLAGAYERIAADLRAGLFGTAGEAPREGSLQGTLRRLRETVGQHGGWRSERELIRALKNQQEKVLAAFGAADAEINDDRVRSIVFAERSVAAGLASQIRTVERNMGRNRRAGCDSLARMVRQMGARSEFRDNAIHLSRLIRSFLS